MPEDMYSQAYGESCMRCGREERVHNKKWCNSCITLPRRQREQILAETAAEAMRWVPIDRRSPPPVAPTGPSGVIVCGSCAYDLWQILADERQVCAQCGERRR